jgi:hypothetical protein
MIATVVVLLSLFARDYWKPNAQNIAATQIFEKKTHKTFNINVPADWREIEFDSTFIYLPPGAEATDLTAEKLTVTVSALPKTNKATIETLMDDDVRETKKVMPNIQEIKIKEPTLLGGLSGMTTRYSATLQKTLMEIDQIDAILRTQTFKYDLVYKFGHTCKLDRCQHTGTVKAIANSFEPIDPQIE